MQMSLTFTNAHFLTLGLFVASALCAAVWRPWRKRLYAVALGQHVQRFLVSLYWVLCGMLGLTGISSTAFWSQDSSLWKSNSPLGSFLVVTTLVILDMVAFGLIIAPLVMQTRRGIRGFFKTVIGVECVLVAPMILLILWALLIFLRIRHSL